VNIRPGIKLLKEIEGYGDPIEKGDRFESVYKFFYNKGDPILFDTCWHKPIPELVKVDGQDVIGWIPPQMVKTNVVYDHNGWLERQSDLVVGLYYSLMGMRQMGYRHVKIAPHFMANSIFDAVQIKKESVIVVEIFLLLIKKAPLPT
jgi:hypothetical protein